MTHVLIIVSWLGGAVQGAAISTQEFASAERCDAARLALIDYAKARGAEETLRKLLHQDLWPHPSRSSFVTLLVEKAVPTNGVGLEKAVGLRLTFRQPPPIDCFSNQFLMGFLGSLTPRLWTRSSRSAGK